MWSRGFKESSNKGPKIRKQKRLKLMTTNNNLSRRHVTPPPQGYLTTYDEKMGVEVFEIQDRWFLKILTKLMNVWIFPVLSTQCFHQWGGAKMMLRELKAWMKPGDFVYKTDVYSYYASINHGILFQQLKSIKWPLRYLQTVIDYCERTILRIGDSLHCSRGIPKGGSLSPVLGSLYLTPLDHAMERWVARGDCFYARFQDDIILVSRKRHVLKRMRKEMFQILTDLQLTLRYEKTFVGRSQKDFDLLGYTISPQGLSPSQKTQEKALETAKRRYAQGGQKSLVEYLNRWRTWVHAGLPFKVNNIDEIIKKISNFVVDHASQNLSQKQSRVGDGSQVKTYFPKYQARVPIIPLVCSVEDGVFNFKKGISSCLKNFSGQRVLLEWPPS